MKTKLLNKIKSTEVPKHKNFYWDLIFLLNPQGKCIIIKKACHTNTD